jgi:hypothetical protein
MEDDGIGSALMIKVMFGRLVGSFSLSFEEGSIPIPENWDKSPGIRDMILSRVIVPGCSVFLVRSEGLNFSCDFSKLAA